MEKSNRVNLLVLSSFPTTPSFTIVIVEPLADVTSSHFHPSIHPPIHPSPNMHNRLINWGWKKIRRPRPLAAPTFSHRPLSLSLFFCHYLSHISLKLRFCPRWCWWISRGGLEGTFFLSGEGKKTAERGEGASWRRCNFSSMFNTPLIACRLPV